MTMQNGGLQSDGEVDESGNGAEPDVAFEAGGFPCRAS